MDQQKNKQQKERPDDLTKKSGGRQGVDKAAGAPRGNEEEMKNAQKAKKVDADPSKATDRPA